MTASAGVTKGRKKATRNEAINKVARDYDNNQLNQDFANWINNDGYENSGGYSGYGIRKTKSKYFDKAGMRDDMIHEFTQQQKNDLENYMNQNFSDLGTSNLWLDNYWNNNSANDYVNNFITTNYDNALTQLDRALKRGTLSQSGYDNALNNLNTQKSGAQTTIGNIGQGILDDYRTALTEKAQGFGANIDNYDLSKYGNVTADKFANSFNDLYNNQQNNFESQFNLATQDIKPFDITGIIGDARVAQGVNNTQSDELLNAIEENEQKKDKKVGLGNKGLF